MRGLTCQDGLGRGCGGDQLHVLYPGGRMRVLVVGAGREPVGERPGLLGFRYFLGDRTHSLLLIYTL